VRLCDAADVLPASRIFTYTETGSYAGFANFFRYKLLLKRGGWYVDTDTVCLKRFDFATPYVFSSEYSDPHDVANNTIMKAPRASRIMRRAWAYCRRSIPEELRWGDTGSKLITRELKECSLLHYVREPAVFCPVPYADWAIVLDPARRPDISSSTYAIHLWHEMWRRAGQDKDADYDRDCFYEELKRRYL
jgi:mannosyltransferase OCH1-like enzyme